MNQPYTAVIFDLDGVICSTDHYHYLAWKQLADSLGIPFDERTNDLLRGVSRAESLEIILRRSTNLYTAQQKEDFCTQKNQLYVQSLQQLTPADLSPQVRSTLDCLRARGLALAIGSSSRNAALILRRLGLEGYFDAVADGTAITHSKPHPEVFLLAASLLGAAPAQCLVVEDAEAGLEAAKAGGMAAAGIGGAAQSPLADYTLTGFEQLADLLA